ncbi:MAG: hypothetical protein A2Y56_03875 [Candidatus Aminicenantes bacterium RBG_13_63_10]|nr:MAG: hypothetical protein A2Y56_03875 [Candidatus Aminicenantes bacterium RBG_13_63_10]
MSAGCGPRRPKAPLSDAEVVKRFNQIFFNSGVIQRSTWMGVKLGQNPCDLWMMQEIIYQIKPDVIIETGTWFGGSALYYAMLLDELGNSGKVITVDIDTYGDQAAFEFPAFKRNAIFLQGDSVSPDIIKKIEELIGRDKKVMVTLDSLHTKEHVLKELQLYSRFVSPGSYLIVQDTNIHGHPVHPNFPEGPMEALMEFLKGRDDFVIDSSREKFLLTFYPNGYLKRIK